MAEDLTEHIHELFEDFDRATQRLERIPKSAQEKTQKLLKLFYEKDGKDIFHEPAEFLMALDSLSEEIGHAYFTVLEIELQRQKLRKAIENPEEIIRKVTQSGQNPILIQTTQPVQPGGFWYFWAERKKWSTIEKLQKIMQQPQISTSRQVTDILEYCRQLIPEFNRIQDYYQRCLDHLHFYDDENTREIFKTELRMHLSKICGIIRAFARTITEYRKELIGERKRDTAKAIIALQMARAGVEQIPFDALANELSRIRQRD